MSDEELLDTLEDMGADVDRTLERMMGDEALYLKYLRKLPENPNITRLREAVDADDAEKAEMEAHTLKGMALNLGLVPLADLCADVVTDLRSGKKDAAYAQVDDVEKCFRTWAEAIAK